MVALIGWPATASFIRAFGGKRVFVPKKITAPWAQAIVDAIGAEETQKLIDWAADTMIEVPRCRSAMNYARNVEIVAAYTDGTDINELVDRFGLTYRQTMNILKHTDTSVPTDNQLEWGF